jgi:predicted Zn-dependent protease
LTPDGLPDDQTLNSTADRLIGELRALYSAPVVEPYHGPAILLNRAAGVFFHEIFGHRIEGHRQKSAEEGQTFTDKVGKQILPDFISIFDDPTQHEFNGTILNGYYPFDDEAVASERVTIVDKGILRNFLMSRTPIPGFDRSNAHGRRSPGNAPVSRQGNLMVESDKTVPFSQLRQMMIDECKAQGKPYGLVFQDISGGFTTTQRSGPQAFKVIPLYVTRVYVDGRPDEVVRGVDIVGTPLSSFSKIVATGDDPDVFNGTCGAESGWVPVSAVSPSILLDDLEIERQEKSQDKPPILPPPEGTTSAKSESDIIFSALSDEMNRGTQGLKMEGTQPPYYVELTLDDTKSFRASASFGALISENTDRNRSLSADVRVGDYSFDNTNFSQGGQDISRFYRGPRRGGGGGRASVPLEDDYSAIRRAAWQACDSAYKQAVEDLAAKQAWVQNRKIEDRPPDMSKEQPWTHFDEPVSLDIDTGQWTDNLKKLSGLFRDYPWIQSSSVNLNAQAQTQYFLNNEGFKDTRCDRSYVLAVSAATQADDGTNISDGFRLTLRDPGDLPKFDELSAKVSELANGIKERMGAQLAGEYSGPVLLEADAAASILNSLFISNLYSPRQPLSEGDDTGGAEGNALLPKLGLRIFPDFISITDDPTARKFGSEPLAGWYSVDDDGMQPEKITLVEDGKFMTFPMSRIPNKDIQRSNGHGRGPSGSSVDSCPSNVIVTSSKTMSEDQLKQDLISTCRDDGLDYGIIIRSFSRGGPPQGFGGRGFGMMMGQMGRGGQGGPRLPIPAAMYKVSVADGSETPVRDATLEGITLKALRDIMAVGDKPSVTSSEGQGATISIVCPSMLIEGVDLREMRGGKPKLPYLKHPYFDHE